ncbi:mechanosensitive ion channel family protein [Paludibaculum fermentans]|uniref:Mechanosensitive ion channel family protein n=1 Tax=Paludibaculum fermentans TaxID=1473598 RepID=A0A7S7NRS1_PALFE|nr:mechanosensitive ion channel family protein [Paludibaculum fermentans]QOY88651.1 mechanosensitive ion channel family protein [Paludibaculum fermentans]
MTSFLSGIPVQRLDDYLFSALRIGGYLGGAALLNFLLSKLFSTVGRVSADLVRERGGEVDLERAKQTNTVTTIARRVLFSLVWAFAILLALKREVGFEVGPLLAGAGVAGLAIGFAAQSVLKDWIGGFFLLTEGQIRIGDVVKVGDLSGSVEQLSLRTTVLRGYDGAVHVLANGGIQSFTNLTMGFSYAVFDVAVDFDEEPQRLMDVFREVSKEMRSDETFQRLILADIEIAGVDKFTEQGVVVKARLKTQPSQQWTVGRELNRRLRARCAQAGITIATAQRAVQLFEKGLQYDPNPVQPARRP